MPQPLPEPADAELIAQWRAGDEASASTLVHRHAPAVARYLGAAGAGDDVEDLVQEALFRAFRHIDQYRGGASFRTWVITIASNALTDLRRRRVRRPVLSLEGRDVADEHSDPHGELVAHEMADQARDAIGKLPRMQRDVFLLRAQQGAPYEEIAEALGTSAGAARVHYHHAVRRLREALG